MTDPLHPLQAHLQQHGDALRELARALLGSADDAADAVQETWHRALRSPPRHGERLAGWYATLLHNVVRRVRRSTRRRAQREAAVAAARVDAFAADAGAELVRTETTRALLAAIDALEPPFRDVIWQRWFEGKPPRVIAAASGVPLATVKSRLQRGLGMLRAQLGKHGGADWRGALALAFALPRNGTAALAAAGAMTMATTMWLKGAVASVALAAAAVWWLAPAAPVPSPVAERPAAGDAAVAAHAPPPAGPAAREAAPSVAAPVATPAVVPGTATPALVPGLVRGRVVDAGTREPLAGVDVLVVRGLPAGAAPTTPRPSSVADVRPIARTGADGVFELAVAGEASGRVRRDDRAALDWDAPAPAHAGARHELGDIPMRAGRIVRGRLVDERGGPVVVPPAPVVEAGDHSARAAAAYYTSVRLEVWFQPAPARGLREPPPAIALDANGAFASASALPFGLARWSVRGELELVGSAMIAIGPEEPSELLLTVRSRPRIRGRIVDEHGAPMVGIGVAQQANADSIWVTDADGNFTLLRLGDQQHATTHVHVAQAPGCEPHAPLRDVAWGRDDVRIVLRRLRPFVIEVVGEDGAAIERFGVAVGRVGQGMRTAPVKQRDRHAGGRLQVDGVVRGSSRLRVLPDDPAFAPSEVLDVLDVAGADAERPLRVVLRARSTFDVEVQRGGEPVANVHVALLREHGEHGGHAQPTGAGAVSHAGTASGGRVAGTGSLQAPPEASWLHGPGAPSRPAWLHGPGVEPIAQGRTDAAGRVALRRDRDLRGCVLHLQPDGASAAVVRGLVLPNDGGPLRVELPGHGTIAGRVHAPSRDGAPMWIAVPTAGLVQGRTVAVDARGAFRIDGLQAGRHRLLPLWRCQRAPAVVLEAALDVDVRADAVTEVELKIGPTPTATVTGRVTADAPLPEGLAVEFVRQLSGDGSQVLASAAVAADGAFPAVELVAGEYRVAFRTKAAGAAAVPALLAEPFVFAAGESRELALRWASRRLVVELRNPDGSTVRNEPVTMRCAGVEWGRLAIFVPPVDERVVLDPAPLLPVEFRSNHGDAPWSAPVVMPDGVAEHEVSVVLPEAPR